MVLFFTLCFLRSNFGEEGNLRHGHKRQTQDLQEQPNDELGQLPRETTYGKHVKQKTPESMHTTL